MMTNRARLKASVFIGSSIDEYIATKDGDVEWLMEFGEEGEDYGYKQFIADIDALVMGRNSYEKVMSFSEWPYKGKRVIVLSKTLTSVCEQAELFEGSIPELIEKLRIEGVAHIYVDGGKIISSFLNLNLIDEMILTLVPVFMGEGIPLFNKLNHKIACTLKNAKSYPSGIVQLHYLLKRENEHD